MNDDEQFRHAYATCMALPADYAPARIRESGKPYKESENGAARDAGSGHEVMTENCLDARPHQAIPAGKNDANELPGPTSPMCSVERTRHHPPPLHQLTPSTIPIHIAYILAPIRFPLS